MTTFGNVPDPASRRRQLQAAADDDSDGVSVTFTAFLFANSTQPVVESFNNTLKAFVASDLTVALSGTLSSIVAFNEVYNPEVDLGPLVATNSSQAPILFFGAYASLSPSLSTSPSPTPSNAPPSASPVPVSLVLGLPLGIIVGSSVGAGVVLSSPLCAFSASKQQCASLAPSSLRQRCPRLLCCLRYHPRGGLVTRGCFRRCI